MNQNAYNWDAQQYAKYSCAQFKWAKELIAKFKLQGDEAVLDIGCGDGKVTTLIADRLSRGKVLGIDSSLDMITLAKRRQSNYLKHRLKFKQMDVRCLNEKNRFDVVFSSAALHWVKRHLQIINRIQQAMKRNGRLLAQMGGRGNAADIVAVLDSMIKGHWAQYFLSFSFPYGFHGSEEYSRWLTDAGLMTIRVELIEKDMLHKGREGFAGWIQTTWLPYLERIPSELRNTFIYEIIDNYLNTHPMDEDGTVHVKMIRLEVEAIKP